MEQSSESGAFSLERVRETDRPEHRTCFDNKSLSATSVESGPSVARRGDERAVAVPELGGERGKRK